MYSSIRWLYAVFVFVCLTVAIELDINDPKSIAEAASTVAFDMIKWYTGNNTGDNPGNLPQPYYWWEAGAMFGHLVEYKYYTGDDTYDDEVVQAITWQAGTDGSFMPPNQTKSEGNDDQVFWAFAAMSAAELGFVPPTQGAAFGGTYPTWTAMAQAVFNQQATRWDTSSCNGGLRWQINPLNNGYTYKNIASNGGFFQLAARLARYTGNDTYVHWAEKSWDWFSKSVLYENKPGAYRVFDGSDLLKDCKEANHDQWSYNYGIILAGLAYIYNHTQDEKWVEPINGVLNATLSIFFPSGKIISEVGCEPYAGGCGTDALTFKSFTIRWLAVTAQLVNSTASTIWPYIRASGNGAAAQCDGGDDGMTCGYHWNTTTWDGTFGPGQQMSALAAIQANMIPAKDLKPPLTLVTGGTSQGDPSAGTEGNSGNGNPYGPEGAIATREISTGDKAGAAILTILAVVGTVSAGYWITQ